YTLDHRRIFAAAESLRAFAALRPLDDPEGRTEAADAPDPRRTPRGPRLALVRGLGEGTVHRLDEGAEWLIGRRRDAHVPLDYDPFVSAENARVQKVGSDFVLEDLPGSRNGTTLNFRRLEPGERAKLRHGDLVGVGHSALLFWSD
ncbi:MAG TPA: FHA domain-containing protein, partial [Candidatus Thermoplasmatota archaeon]|nr:FHA domain-containing protein [Candidatus Thermoplasmatota archaeon]